MFLIDDLLIWWPAKGLVSAFKKIHDLAEAELNDESKLKEELLMIQTQYELDQINEEEYQNREDAIMAKINEIHQRKKQELLNQ